MINIEKVRLWSVRFALAEEFNSLAFPGMIVEEQEDDTYSMPQCFAADIPAKVGGQITITLNCIEKLCRQDFCCL